MCHGAQHPSTPHPLGSLLPHSVVHRQLVGGKYSQGKRNGHLHFTHSSLWTIPTSIHNQSVEQVSHLKYLGLTIDNNLTFDQHITDIHKRSQQRLHVIRKLRALSVAPHLLSLLYTTIIQPILLYCSPCFYNMLSNTNRNKLTKITHTTSKITNHPAPNLTELNPRAVTRLAQTITNDPTHPLHPYFTLLPSGRRYRTLRWRRPRFNKSCVPSAISALNNLPQ